MANSTSDYEQSIEGQYLSTTVLKAVSILNIIAQKPMLASEISVALNINKTTVHRLLTTLEHVGFIEQSSESHQYRIGIKLVGICSSRVNDIEIITEAKPHLLALVQQINQPVHLGVYNAGMAIFVDKIDIINTMRIYSAIGRSIPIHCSAIGKALLMDWTDADILSALERFGMKSYTSKTITDPEEIVRQIHVARECGYTEDKGEHEDKVFCFAAPVYDYRNKIVAAISTAAGCEAGDDPNRIVPFLIQAANHISVALGYQKLDE